MKQIHFFIFLFLVSCADNSDRIQGSWSITQSSSNGNFTNSPYFLWNTLIFRKDSVFMFEDQFFKGSHSRYKLDDDSIEFLISGNPKYQINFKNGLLELNGYSTIRGCRFRERRTYKRLTYVFTKEKMLNKDTINNYQLSIGSWCYKKGADIERYISSENRQIPKNMNDSTGISYFPKKLNFNSPNIKFNSNLEFSNEWHDYSISHYSGHQLVILFQSNDTNYYMQYSLCEDRIIELN